MIWPDSGNADFLELAKIKNKSNSYPYVIHWAGIKCKHITQLPRADILIFYKNFFYSRLSKFQKYINKFSDLYFSYEAMLKKLFFKFRSKYKSIIKKARE